MKTLYEYVSGSGNVQRARVVLDEHGWAHIHVPVKDVYGNEFWVEADHEKSVWTLILVRCIEETAEGKTADV